MQAVAARDKQRATAFAKKHGIPQVLDSYEGTSAPAGDPLRDSPKDLVLTCLSQPW